MNRFRSLPRRHHGVHWVMLIILVLHALAPHGGWRDSVRDARFDPRLQNLAPPDLDAALGFICGAGEAGRKTLPQHDSDCLKCLPSLPLPWLLAWVVACVLALRAVRLPAFDDVPSGLSQVYACPWPTAPPPRLC
jgi:hypothetical protein